MTDINKDWQECPYLKKNCFEEGLLQGSQIFWSLFFFFPKEIRNKYISEWEISYILNAGQTKDGEGNGTPLQYSCLGNPMDGGAW